MGNINDLVGDAAKSLMVQAEAMENQALKERAKQVARSVSAQARDEMISAARNAPFARVPLWLMYLPIGRLQQLIIGRIYSFQCTSNRDGSQAEYRMSLAKGASELRVYDRVEMLRELNALMKLGFITKRSNGPRTPATYLVDEVVCMTEARRNGYPG